MQSPSCISELCLSAVVQFIQIISLQNKHKLQFNDVHLIHGFFFLISSLIVLGECERNFIYLKKLTCFFSSLISNYSFNDFPNINYIPFNIYYAYFIYWHSLILSSFFTNYYYRRLSWFYCLVCWNLNKNILANMEWIIYMNFPPFYCYVIYFVNYILIAYFIFYELALYVSYKNFVKNLYCAYLFVILWFFISVNMPILWINDFKASMNKYS